MMETSWFACSKLDAEIIILVVLAALTRVFAKLHRWLVVHWPLSSHSAQLLVSRSCIISSRSYIKSAMNGIQHLLEQVVSNKPPLPRSAMASSTTSQTLKYSLSRSLFRYTVHSVSNGQPLIGSIHVFEIQIVFAIANLVSTASRWLCVYSFD